MSDTLLNSRLGVTVLAVSTVSAVNRTVYGGRIPFAELQPVRIRPSKLVQCTKPRWRSPTVNTLGFSLGFFSHRTCPYKKIQRVFVCIFVKKTFFADTFVAKATAPKPIYSRHL